MKLYPTRRKRVFCFVLFSVAFFPFFFFFFASSYRVRLVEPAGSLSLLEEAPSQASGAALSKSRHLVGCPRCSPGPPSSPLPSLPPSPTLRLSLSSPLGQCDTQFEYMISWDPLTLAELALALDRLLGGTTE